jgi:hypothetical protein
VLIVMVLLLLIVANANIRGSIARHHCRISRMVYSASIIMEFQFCVVLPLT